MLVLVLDDEPTNCEIAGTVARRAGATAVVSFDDPLAALAWLETNTPDLILLDHMMPGMDGLEVLRSVRAAPQLVDVPVVMITANSLSDLRLEALEHGATDFISKPIRPQELRARLRNLLALRRSQALLRDRAAHLAHEVAEATAEIRSREVELINRMSRASEFRDPETGAHIERMAHYSRMIAERLGLNASYCQSIFVAAPMHDIGKLGVPDAILLKPGKLTEQEMAVMRQHAEIGHSILRGSRSHLIQLGAAIAKAHHEKWDGTGYPSGLKGTDIPLPGRIVAVADVFDALTSTRPYKTAWPVEQARAYLLTQEGRHFDPACLGAFLDRWQDALDIFERIRDPELAHDQYIE